MNHRPTASTSHPGALALILLAGVASLATLACGDDLTGPDTDPDALSAAEAWELVRLRGPAGDEPIHVGPRGLPTLHFTRQPLDGGLRVHGDGGCNVGGGAYRAEPDGSLILSELAFTDMLCRPATVIASEGAFFEALGTVGSFHFERERLVVQFEGGLLEFAPVERLEAEPAAGHVEPRVALGSL